MVRSQPGDNPLPAAIPLECPTCGEETEHTVLKGTIGLRGEYTLDAVVRCETCANVRHTVHRESAERQVAAIVSAGSVSRRTGVLLGDDEELAVGDEIVLDGVRCIITAVETKQGRRPARLAVPDIATLWAKEFEMVNVGFTINLGKKTIAKSLVVAPEHRFEIGEEHTFDRLRVTVHGIKTDQRMLRRGGAEAGEIRRIFAKPTKLPQATRPRRTRPLRERREEARTARRPAGKGRKPR